MKTLGLIICFVVWLIVTLMLVISILGMFLFIREDSSCKNWQGEQGESAWLKIGRKIINKLTE